MFWIGTHVLILKSFEKDVTCFNPLSIICPCAGSYIHIRCWTPPPPHCGTEEYGLQNQGCIRYHHRHGSYPHYHTGKHFRPAFSNCKRVENLSKLCFRFQESYVQIITRPEALSGVHQLQYSGVYGNALVFIVLF